MSLHISQIRTDGGTQSRAALNEVTVAEYADAMADPDTVFPPIIAYFDGRDYWLADGFHRLEAWKRIGREEIPADIRQGDRRRAILHSVAANRTHGLRRTNDDKRRAVLNLLEDDEWSQWSNREIARRCGVSDVFVGKVRDDASANGLQMVQTRTVERNGTVYQQDTANIGARSNDGQKTESAQQTEKTHEIADKSDDENHQVQTDQENTPPTEPIDPDEAKARRDLAKLTQAALIDDVIGLRAALDDERAKRRKLEAENRDLKARLRDATDSDTGEVIRRLQASVKQAENEKWRQSEATVSAMKQVYALKKRVAELEEMRIAL